MITLLALVGSMNVAQAEAIDDTWNRADLYPTLEAWQAEVDALPGSISALDRCEGRLTTSVRELKGCLDELYAVQHDLERAWVYASTGADENTGNAEAQARRMTMLGIINQFEEATSFMAPELIAGEETIRSFMGRGKKLELYQVYLDDVLRMAPHTLSAEGEQIMAAAGLIQAAPGNTYRILSNADIPWPTITLSDGTEARLSPAGFTQHRTADNRADRKAVFDNFFGTWKSYQDTMGTTMSSHVQAHIFEARQRHFDSSLAAALTPNNVPTEVYRTLVTETRRNLPTLHRYLKLRKRMLGLEDMGYHDLYIPMIEGSSKTFGLDEAKSLTLESLRIMGDDFTSVVETGFNNRWIDVYPRENKRSGAYQTGVYGVHPYVLLNYTSDYDSVSTLTHEFGHAMHTWLADEAQPYQTADYAIFMAEVASTFNEALLLEYMLDNAKSDDERLTYLGAALNNLRGTYFRQAMFAEFELAIHDAAEAGTALTGKELTKMYAELLQAYHGTEQGVMELDPVTFMEWAYIPHFYYNFYVFQYATSISASSLLAQRVIDEEPGAKEAYLDLLRAGGSAPAYQLLKDAGIDLATAAPYEAISQRMNRIMDEIEAILDRQGK